MEVFIVIVACLLLIGIGGCGGGGGHATIVDPDKLKEARIEALKAKKKK
nr:MAG TPA: hypothetical protein [Caudoviricetes sp.]